MLIDHATLVGDLHERSVCETDDGALLPPSRVRQLACEAGILPVVLSGESVPLDVGRARRWFTPGQRLALRAAYRTCAMARCDVAFAQCEIHHIDHWEKGGSTNLDNGVPLCSRCHHLIHQPGWRLKLDDHRTLTVTTPTGKRLVSSPGTDPPPGSLSP